MHRRRLSSNTSICAHLCSPAFTCGTTRSAQRLYIEKSEFPAALKDQQRTRWRACCRPGHFPVSRVVSSSGGESDIVSVAGQSALKVRVRVAGSLAELERVGE